MEARMVCAAASPAHSKLITDRKILVQFTGVPFPLHAYSRQDAQSQRNPVLLLKIHESFKESSFCSVFKDRSTRS
jgi:hypothetical protein